MKSIKRLFEKIEKQNPIWGSYIVFANAINTRNFSHDRIARMFGTLVDKSEYSRSEKRGLLEYLYSLNEPLNRTKNEDILPGSGEIKAEMDTYDVVRDKDGIEEVIPTRTIPSGELPF